MSSKTAAVSAPKSKSEIARLAAKMRSVLLPKGCSGASSGALPGSPSPIGRGRVILFSPRRPEEGEITPAAAQLDGGPQRGGGGAERIEIFARDHVDAG